jgi:hypothetical protein
MSGDRVEAFSREFSSVVPLLTMNRRGHWAIDDDARKNWKTWGRRMGAITKAQRGAMDEPVKITCAIYWPDRRRRDVGNYTQTAKAIVDGIVLSGLVSDDRDTVVVGPDMRRIPFRGDRTHAQVIVIIEETSIDAELAAIERAALGRERN